MHYLTTPNGDVISKLKAYIIEGLKLGSYAQLAPGCKFAPGAFLAMLTVF